MSSKTETGSYDVVIAGGGYVGMTTAVAIAHEAPHLRVCVVEGAPEEALYSDERASAIAAAARRMLEFLGIWHMIEDHAQPITEMIITDSKLSDVTRPTFLTFGSVEEEVGPDGPFAHMMPNKELVHALREKARKLGIELIFSSGVTAFERQGHAVDVTLSDGRHLPARLLVAADGVRSRLREMAGIKTVHWPYGQWGIVTTVRHERDHQGRAEEHFLPAGPFAILPLKGIGAEGNRSSLVWTEREEDARRILAMDEFGFELELEQRFGHKLGEIEVEGPTKGFPLGLTLSREYIGERFVLAGDAAHGVHPISGQGLNLGFKDAAALAEVIVDADRLGLDIGSVNVLERYQQWRRFDVWRMGVVTDVLNRMFSNDNPLMRAARDFGLGMVDRLPGLKRMFIDQAAGKQQGSPKLLRGEGL